MRVALIEVLGDPFISRILAEACVEARRTTTVSYKRLQKVARLYDIDMTVKKAVFFPLLVLTKEESH